MSKTYEEIRKYIEHQLECDWFCEENMEVYKLNLPYNIINMIITFNHNKPTDAELWLWNNRLGLMDCHIRQNRRNCQNIEDDIVCFCVVYKIPSLEYLKTKMKISAKRYELMYNIRHSLLYNHEHEDIKVFIKEGIIRTKMNVERTIKDFNEILKITFEQQAHKNSKKHLNFCPQLVL